MEMQRAPSASIVVNRARIINPVEEPTRLVTLPWLQRRSLDRNVSLPLSQLTHPSCGSGRER